MTVELDHGTTPELSGDGGNVHVVLVGTKPDIIKQAPIYLELKKRGHATLMVHTGQHYDHSLSGAMLEEFGVDQIVNLRAGGDVTSLVSTVIARLGGLLGGLAEDGRVPVTYVHGDTTTAMSGSVATFGVGQGLVHVEAGLRTLSPTKAILTEWLSRIEDSTLDWSTYKGQMIDRATFERGSREPSPEQFNTRVADAGSHFHAAPVELNREFLLEEGFAPASIEVVGNSIVDALGQSTSPEAKAALLERHPQFASGEFIRYCVHRKENTTSESRFTALMYGMEDLLEQGHSMLFIRLNGTEAAIDRYGLRDWLTGLEDRYGDRFITTPVWDSYAQVLEAMKLCSVVATDSGSIQEELNILGVPCVTLRFGSERGESLLAGTNFIAPPTSRKAVSTVIDMVHAHRDELSPQQAYPDGASAMLVDAVEQRLAATGTMSFSEEWRYGLA